MFVNDQLIDKRPNVSAQKFIMRGTVYCGAWVGLVSAVLRYDVWREEEGTFGPLEHSDWTIRSWTL